MTSHKMTTSFRISGGVKGRMEELPDVEFVVMWGRSWETDQCVIFHCNMSCEAVHN